MQYKSEVVVKLSENVNNAGVEKIAIKDQLFTVPNLLSILRLFMLAGFLILLGKYNDRVAATVVLAVAGVTDFLDGYIARHFNQVTELGKILDPSADRILVTGAMIGAITSHSIPLVLAVIILFRELIMMVSTVLLAILGAKRIDVVWVGKAGTFGLMTAIPGFILSSVSAGHHVYLWQSVIRDATWIAVIPSLVLSYLATLTYIPKAVTAFKEGRRERLK